MANVKTQGTQLFTVIDGQVVRFVCTKKIGFGQDSDWEIDVTCLDAETKEYMRGMRDPGEGAIDIDYDDTNIVMTSLRILQKQVKSLIGMLVLVTQKPLQLMMQQQVLICLRIACGGHLKVI